MKRTTVLSALTLSLFVAAAVQCDPNPMEGESRKGEVLRYRWGLGGFLGSVARLFIPGRGDGLLSTHRNEAGHLVSELRVTSGRSRRGEYWMYGAEIDPVDQTTLRAWTSQYFRGEAKEQSAELESESVIDFTSGILLLRQDPPLSVRRMTIWSSGKLYPVDVVPTGTEARDVSGEKVTVRGFVIRGARVEGQRFWKGRLHLFLAQDEFSTPVEIRMHRRGAKVRLELLAAESELPGADRHPLAKGADIPSV